jgi:transposase
MMRGLDERTGELFSYVDPEARVRRDHPWRAIRNIVNEALSALAREMAPLYAGSGRPSIAPERLLRAMLLQAFYSIRSERQLMERLEFDLLYRWFVGRGLDDPVWDHSTFSKNRDRLLDGDVAAKVLSAVLARPRVRRLLSTDQMALVRAFLAPEVPIRIATAAGRRFARAVLRLEALHRGPSLDQRAVDREVSRRPIRRRRFTARARARRRSCASWAMP